MTPRVAIILACSLSLAGCESATTTPVTNGGGTTTTTIPLAVTCPAAVSTSTAAATIAVAYAAPATTGGTLPVTASCTPASGTQFAKGATTTVTCSASDSAGKTASCTFGITVAVIPLLKGTKFLAFGDSFTAGEILNASRAQIVNDSKSYPTLLKALLLSQYTAQDFNIPNYGNPGEVLMSDLGYRSEETRLRWLRALTVERPDAVLILEGVNDLNSVGITNDQIAGVLSDMVQEAYAAQVKMVYVATEPPQIPGLLRSSQAARVPDLNTKITAVARAQGATLVDLYGAMIGNVTGLINADDGLHPYPAGYAVMAQTFFTSIKNTFELTTSAAATSAAKR